MPLGWPYTNGTLGLARLQVEPLRTIMSAVGLLVKEIEAGFVSGCLAFLGQGFAESSV
jgi:hypothetical protein